MTPTSNEQPLPEDFSVSEPFALPSTMESLLKAAIEDARSLDHSLYRPFFDNWHYSEGASLCNVCLAGSLIAGRLRNSPSKNISSDDFSNDTDYKLRAVDSMRLGHWRPAFIYLYDIQPRNELAAKLDALPRPLKTTFCGWSEFEVHLKSMEAIIPSLAEIDNLAASAG